MTRTDMHLGAKQVTNLNSIDKPILANVPKRIDPTAILMCEPTYFQVVDVKNPFMEGHVGSTKQNMAVTQWQEVKKAFESTGFPVIAVPGAPDREDMVFTANQVLPGVNEKGERYVVLAEMVHESRRLEIPIFAKWFQEKGYKILQLADVMDNKSNVPRFEGQGDAIWHPGRQMLWGGYGFRSQEEAYEPIAKLLNLPIIKLKLANPTFYHLDTAFVPLNETTVMFYPGAFYNEGIALIKHYFANTIEVSDKEANNFACNAVPIGKNVVIQEGSPEICKRLKELGFKPIEVPTTEFMKSGGSACCLKLMIY